VRRGRKSSEANSGSRDLVRLPDEAVGVSKLTDLKIDFDSLPVKRIATSRPEMNAYMRQKPCFPPTSTLSEQVLRDTFDAMLDPST
jgi:hypothetical protein